MRGTMADIPILEALAECGRCHHILYHHLGERRWVTTFERVQMCVLPEFPITDLTTYWGNGSVSDKVAELEYDVVWGYKKYEFLVRECIICKWQWMETTGNTGASQNISGEF